MRATPTPSSPTRTLERPHLEQVWNPTGEPTYELRWSWPGGGGKPGFVIQEATNPALSDSRVIEVPHGETTWRPAKPQPPGHYYYRVRAVKRFGGVTPWSEVRLTKVAYPPPPAPTLTPPDPARPLELNWEGEGEALEYQLERSETPDFAAPEVVYEGRSTSWTVPTSKPGAFHYRVRAISDGGPGPFSAACEVEVKLPPPPRPHLATPGYGYEHGAFSLRWQEVPGATHYELEEMRRGEDEPPRTITVDDTIYEAAEQPVGDYTYRVRACNNFGCSEWSNEQVVLIAPQPPARAPELALEGPDERGAVHLSWNAVPSAQEYHVEASNSPDFASARVYATSDLEVEMVRREAGALYVRVCAANRGGESPWSEVQQSVTEPDPPAWIEASIAADTRRINLAWGASGGRVEYCVEMSSGGEDDYAEVYRGEETQAALDAPAGAGLLRFRVRAEAPGAPSAWTESEPVQASPPLPAPALEQPDLADNGEIRVRWSAVENAGHYRVEFSMSEDFASPRAVSTTTTGVNIRPPSSGQFWVRVRACSGGEGSERCGDPSNVVTASVRRPAAPILHPLDPVRSNWPFDVTWTGVPGCAYYELQELQGEQFPADSTRKTRIFHPAQKLTVSNRLRGRIYFRVKAVTEQGESSVWSNTLAVDVVVTMNEVYRFGYQRDGYASNARL